MAYSKSKLEVHSLIAGLYDKYRERGFIHFKQAPEIKGTQYLEPIIHAIDNKKVLRITYLPFYEDKPYFNEVHPYLLKEHGFRWYLVGWNEFKSRVRTYALDRIRNLEEIDNHTYRAPEFSASDYFKYALGIISPPGAPPLIKLAVQKTQAQYLITQPWHDSQNIDSEDEERVIFSFRLHPTYEFKSMVLSLGKDGEVLEPVSLRDELSRELEQMMVKYR
ncbi:MAG: WYL domain-containing protein [Bacteroidetes bacterium]|nr:WYL domain-containing protein [Bacteroidota bacterium]